MSSDIKNSQDLENVLIDLFGEEEWAGCDGAKTLYETGLRDVCGLLLLFGDKEFVLTITEK